MANSDSFFNEIYGTYFNVVSSILRQAQEKQLTKDSLELGTGAGLCRQLPDHSQGTAGRKLAIIAEGYDYAAAACTGDAVDNVATSLAEKPADG